LEFLTLADIAMKNTKKNRRNFLSRGLKSVFTLGFLSGATVVSADEGKTKVKCLTQDGELVEVEVESSQIDNAQLIKTNELKGWVNSANQKPKNHDQ